MEPINNFRLVSITTEAPPYLSEYDNMEDFQIYNSSFNTDLYVIHDSKFEVYRCLEFMGPNKLELDKNLNIYLNQYYLELSDAERSSVTSY